MAARRWALDRQRRQRLAALRTDQYPNAIVKRIVVIWHERVVRETTIRTWDSVREARRKERMCLAPLVNSTITAS